jgi:hypothetical protein
MENGLKDKERFWSIELSSKASLKNVTITNGARDSALVEGTLGELVRAAFMEGIILEVIGTKGTLRINLGADEIMKMDTGKQGGTVQ